MSTVPAPNKVPGSIKVLVIPADGTEPRYEKVKTVKEEILPPTLPPPHLKPGTVQEYSKWQKDAASHSIFTHWGSLPQPNISILSKIGERDWPAGAWEKRAVCGLREWPTWHVFFTMHTHRDLKKNMHVDGRVSGDLFIVGISDTKDENGRRFYVDVKPDDLDPASLQRYGRSIELDLEIIKAWFDGSHKVT